MGGLYNTNQTYIYPNDSTSIKKKLHYNLVVKHDGGYEANLVSLFLQKSGKKTCIKHRWTEH